MKKKIIALIHIFIAYGILVISNEISFVGYKICTIEPFDAMLRWTIYLGAALLMARLYVKIVMRKTLKQMGMGKPFFQLFWCVIAFALPACVSIFYLLFTNGVLVGADISSKQMISLLVYAIFMGLSSGFVEELLFRGIIMKSIESAWNRNLAIVIPSIIFALIHMGQIDSGNIGSTILLLVGGTACGVMFSMVAYQTGSVWSSVLMHSIWNITIIGGILEIKPFVESYNPSIWTYVLDENSILVTGGTFGIETSIISIIGYGIVIFIAWWKMRHTRTHFT